jgi:hypothetical protein
VSVWGAHSGGGVAMNLTAYQRALLAEIARDGLRSYRDIEAALEWPLGRAGSVAVGLCRAGLLRVTGKQRVHELTEAGCRRLEAAVRPDGAVTRENHGEKQP